MAKTVKLLHDYMLSLLISGCDTLDCTHQYRMHNEEWSYMEITPQYYVITNEYASEHPAETVLYINYEHQDVHQARTSSTYIKTKVSNNFLNYKIIIRKIVCIALLCFMTTEITFYDQKIFL